MHVCTVQLPGEECVHSCLGMSVYTVAWGGVCTQLPGEECVQSNKHESCMCVLSSCLGRSVYNHQISMNHACVYCPVAGGGYILVLNVPFIHNTFRPCTNNCALTYMHGALSKLWAPLCQQK